MNARYILDNAIKPALALLPPYLNTPKAIVMMLATGYQESKFTARRQMGDGPARGFWQFEKGGGVKGVCQHRATGELARLLCRERDVSFDPLPIWVELEHDDVLAAGFARLLLLSDPKPLPDEEGAGWEYYLRCWRPGKPRPAEWADSWAFAQEEQ